MAYGSEDSAQIYCEKHANINDHKENPIKLSEELEVKIIALCELEKDLVLLQTQKAFLKWENEFGGLAISKDLNENLENNFKTLKAALK